MRITHLTESLPPFLETLLIQSASACQSALLCRASMPAAEQSNLTQTCPPCSALPYGDSSATDIVEGEREKKKTREEISALALLSLGGVRGGAASLAIKYLFKGERLLTICLPMRGQRQGGDLFFLLSFFTNKDRERKKIFCY